MYTEDCGWFVPAANGEAERQVQCAEGSAVAKFSGIETRNAHNDVSFRVPTTRPPPKFDRLIVNGRRQRFPRSSPVACCQNAEATVTLTLSQDPYLHNTQGDPYFDKCFGVYLTSAMQCFRVNAMVIDAAAGPSGDRRTVMLHMPSAETAASVAAMEPKMLHVVYRPTSDWLPAMLCSAIHGHFLRSGIVSQASYVHDSDGGYTVKCTHAVTAATPEASGLLSLNMCIPAGGAAKIQSTALRVKIAADTVEECVRRTGSANHCVLAALGLVSIPQQTVAVRDGSSVHVPPGVFPVSKLVEWLNDALDCELKVEKGRTTGKWPKFKNVQLDDLANMIFGDTGDSIAIGPCTKELQSCAYSNLVPFEEVKGKAKTLPVLCDSLLTCLLERTNSALENEQGDIILLAPKAKGGQQEITRFTSLDSSKWGLISGTYILQTSSLPSDFRDVGDELSVLTSACTAPSAFPVAALANRPQYVVIKSSLGSVSINHNTVTVAGAVKRFAARISKDGVAEVTIPRGGAQKLTVSVYNEDFKMLEITSPFYSVLRRSK